MKLIKTSLDAWFIWMKWGKKFRWVSFECSPPAWKKPTIEKYSYGKRIGWGLIAIGTGVVTKDTMNKIQRITSY